MTHLCLFHLALEGDILSREERWCAGERWRWLGELEVEEDPVGPAGPNCLATWADSREKCAGHKKEWAEIRNGLQKPFSDLNQGFEFKNQGFKYF
jgi:hypothetical protein